jgi:murein DD-endopeptidase MepM/ murein hydrolase activator NlpD
LDELQVTMDDLERLTLQRTDLLTLLESRLFERKMQSLRIPTQRPVTEGDIGSAFGWRLDPISGHSALHTGLDFPAPVSTPILAAAGGVVVTQEFHPEYGNMVEIDHGNELVTRYAHASKVWVKVGDLVKRGQKVAEVGASGRSTGSHLHFEVLVQGIPQDPQKFLNQSPLTQVSQMANAAGLTPARNSGRSKSVTR